LYAALDDRVLVVSGAEAGPTAHERLVGTDLECVASASGAPARAFVGTVSEGIRRTTDGGDSWERVAPDIDDRVTALTVCPHDPDRVWAGTEPSAVYRSEDGGETWAERPGLTDLPSADEWSFPPRPHTHHVRWIEVDPRDPDRLYVAIEAGALVRSTDGGETWLERPEGGRRDNHTLATHPDAPERVYSAAGDGYAESTDGGETWHEAMEGLDHRYCWSVAVDPADPGLRVMSAASGAYRAHRPGSAETYCYRRRDDGPWERITDGLPTGEGVLRAVLDSGGAGEFYAVNSEGLYRSTDAGVTWHEVDLGPAWLDRFAEEPPRALVVG
jgi:photosystem II stability/assembly factor-like uncharacterized protein